MSYVKGGWSGKRIDLSVHYFESIKTEVCFTGKTDVAIGNAKRIIDCVNACDGMDDPSHEIAKLRSFVVMLSNSLESCAKELASMIDAHNEQSMEDGSWKYDHQTPWEAMFLIEKMKAK